MKAFFILCLLLLPVSVFSQVLTLELSTPQPRLGDSFTISFNIDTVASNIFSGLLGEFAISPIKNASNEGSKLGVTLTASKLGKTEIGPFSLKINNETYTTDKLDFEIVDSLPQVNQGIWIRKVPINDTSLYLLIDQRIPALTYITHNANSINLTTKTNDEDKEIEMVQDAPRINFHGSISDMKSFIDPKTGNELKFKSFFAMYKIIFSKDKPTVITKADFNNIPDYYKFKDITVN
jgi:hypothetical protein